MPFSKIQSEAGTNAAGASYSIIVPQGSSFEIPMRGSSWTFVGLSKGRPDGLFYLNRRFESSSIYFIFQAKQTGEYLLDFIRQDLLLDEAENIVIRVLVEADAGLGASPIIQVSPSPGELSRASPTALLPETPSPEPSAAEDFSVLSASELLRRANAELNASKAEAARKLVQEYALRYREDDEFLFLAARAFEAPGEGRDITRARAYYAKLRDFYPESPYARQAAGRVDYIDRRYLEIR